MPEITVVTPRSGAPRVEIALLHDGESLTTESFSFRELIVVVAGCISLERSDCVDPELHVATETIEIPVGVTRRITAHETPTHLVLIHPQLSP